MLSCIVGSAVSYAGNAGIIIVIANILLLLQHCFLCIICSPFMCYAFHRGDYSLQRDGELCFVVNKQIWHLLVREPRQVADVSEVFLAGLVAELDSVCL